MSVENKLIEFKQKSDNKISCIFEFQPAIRTLIISEYYDHNHDYYDYYEYDYYETNYQEKRVSEALSYHQFHIDYVVKKQKQLHMNSFLFTETEIPCKNSKVVNLISIAENINSGGVCLGNINTVFNYDENNSKDSVLLASNKLINHFF
jgi:hypothetical protein